MDRDNLDDLGDLGGVSPRVLLFRDFDPVEPGGDVPDPYYGGDAGFEEVLSMVERTSEQPRRRPAAEADEPGDDPSAAGRPARRGAARLAVVATAPVAGGDVCAATQLRLSDGTTALMKTLNNAPPQFFASEVRRARAGWPRPAGSRSPTCWPPTTTA